MFKAEAAKSLDVSSTVQDAEINQVIFDVQQWLASIYSWPFLEHRWDIQVPAGSRYLNFPTVDEDAQQIAIDFERNNKLEVKWSSTWQSVEYGIGSEEFNYMDSDLGQVLDPIQRWRFNDEGNFEIWPMTAGPQLLRFTGQRVLTELRSAVGPPPTWDDTALLDLDDLMVVFFSVAEYAMREEQTQVAKLHMSKAQNRMQQVRATYPKRTMECRIGGQIDRRLMRVVPMVLVAGANSSLGNSQTGSGIGAEGGGGFP